MTGRERIEAALSPDGASEIGAVICYEGIYYRDRWDDLTRLPWWYRHAPDVERQMAWRRDVFRRIDQDWMVLPAVAARAQRRNWKLEEREGGVFLADRQTGRERELERELVGGWSASYATPAARDLPLPRSRDDMDDLLPVPVLFEPNQIARTGRDELARALLSEFGGDRFPVYHVSAPLWATYGVLGFERMMVLIGQRPDLVEYACERLLRRTVREVRVAASLGAAGVWIEDCMTDLVSPSAFLQLNLPFLRLLTEEIRSRGMSSIHYFCGNPRNRWDHLLETGADALALEESKKGFTIDIEDVIERVGGRMAVLGNLDAIGLLEHGSEFELRTEISRQVQAGRRNGSRFVMSLGSPVTPGTSPQRVRLYIDLAHDAGSW